MTTATEAFERQPLAPSERRPRRPYISSTGTSLRATCSSPIPWYSTTSSLSLERDPCTIGASLLLPRKHNHLARAFGSSTQCKQLGWDSDPDRLQRGIRWPGSRLLSFETRAGMSSRPGTTWFSPRLLPLSRVRL
ncbi:hypothetical protein BT96DRAFT_291003 [Gymnopus androsaceus JB14]|uniref:Uncharacterized protein n=1 Tax=Gymnopus androsaceus JB14 TaxID=1447944 RepID=A0A6A4H0Z6_9AGAR|nr:hypothetical protein BT96DRAFT_291003 [Gymnopus androsaceus JB14]